jgi:hypothetical protein
MTGRLAAGDRSRSIDWPPPLRSANFAGVDVVVAQQQERCSASDWPCDSSGLPSSPMSVRTTCSIGRLRPFESFACRAANTNTNAELAA